jgi:ArsR family transcriptional regulator
MVSLEPALNVTQSLLLLGKAEKMSGLDEWVTRTVQAFTPKERDRLRLVTICLPYALIPEQSWPSFPAYLEHLATCDPTILRDKLLRFYARFPPSDSGECQEMGPHPLSIDREAVLESADAYVGFLRKRFSADHLDEALEARAYAYVMDPPAMQDLIVSYMRDMWEKHLAAEWERVRPMVQDAVAAFRQIDLNGMSKLQAAEEILGRKLEESKAQVFGQVERLVFVPSAHVGPYLWKFHTDDALQVLFGARLPRGVQFSAPDLSRAEILVRLNALADSNRLHILQLISEEGEQRSQDVIERLALSQSTVSRHLKQLVATGYLVERRCNGAKCYKLNPEQITDTLQAISTLLLGS